VDVGAVLNQSLHDFSVLLRHRPHQRCLSMRFFFRVCLGSVCQQHLDGVRIARPRSRHQRRLAGIESHFGIRPGF
jgi:hypothetical protein